MRNLQCPQGAEREGMERCEVEGVGVGDQRRERRRGRTRLEGRRIRIERVESWRVGIGELRPER